MTRGRNTPRPADTGSTARAVGGPPPRTWPSATPFRNGRVEGVVTAQGLDVRCRAVVSNTSATTLAALVGPEPLPAEYRSEAAPRQTSMRVRQYRPYASLLGQIPDPVKLIASDVSCQRMMWHGTKMSQ